MNHPQVAPQASTLLDTSETNNTTEEEPQDTTGNNRVSKDNPITINTKNNYKATVNRNRAVPCIRWIFLAVLVVTTVTVASIVYSYTSAKEHDELKTQFASDSDKLLSNIGRNFQMTMGAADSFMYGILFQVRSTHTSEWPMVTIPGLAVQTAKLIGQTDSIHLAFYPLIQREDRKKWENFTRNNNDWVEESLRVQAKNPHFHGPIMENYTKSHVIWNNEGLEPEDAEGPFLPSWMGSPVIPTYPPYNWNALAYPAFGNGLLHTMRTKSVAVTPVANHADPDDPIAVEQARITSEWAIPYIDADEDSNEPFSDLYYPVLDTPSDSVVVETNTAALGTVAFSFYWRHTLKNILPPQSKGIVIVIETPCGNQQKFTYQVDGPKPIFLGCGDKHETEFDHLAKSRTLAELSNVENTGYTGVPMSSEFCPYTLTAYPSSTMKDSFITAAPAWSALGSALTFIFVAALFCIYDVLVRREFNAKQRLLEAKRHFVRFVSHEVRTPLNAVCLGLSLLHDEMEQVITESKKTNSNNEPNSSSETTRSSVQHQRQEQEQLKELHAKLEGWMQLNREICDSAESSVGVLNDLLTYDKVSIGSFTMEFTVFSAWRLVEETSREFQLSARRKNIEYALDNQMLQNVNDIDSTLLEDPEDASGRLDSLKIVGDWIRITQILRNLVSNAIKFTPEEGSLTIRTSWYPVEKSKRTWDKYTLKDGSVIMFKRRGIILIQVIDSGVGLTETQLKSLFKDGTQFDVNKLQGGQGSGLGLFISRGMAIQHGGDVKAASEGLGLGSTFTLQLPLYHIPNQQAAEDPTSSSSDSTSLRPHDVEPLHQQVKSEAVAHSSLSSVQPPSPSPAAPGLPSDQSLRILVVDDVASNRKLISRMARNRNHHVDEAVDGRDAVERVKASIVENNPYDTILMDYEMPHQNGPDAVLEIRRMGCDSLIVGVTGNVLEEDIKHFISCGADSVLAKPVKFRALEEMWAELGNFE